MHFGFHKEHSTDHTTVHFINKILESSKNKCYTLGVFIGLTKVFDTVDHNTLIRNLFRYGVRGNDLKILQSYLQNIKQSIAY